MEPSATEVALVDHSFVWPEFFEILIWIYFHRWLHKMEFVLLTENTMHGARYLGWVHQSLKPLHGFHLLM